MIRTVYSSPLTAVGKPCPYCGVPMLAHPGKPGPISRFTVTRDHVFPRSKGGGVVIIVCSGCNREKADMSPFEWIEHLWTSGRRDHAKRAVYAYCLTRDVFRLGTNPEDVLAAMDGFAIEVAA